MQGVPTLWKLPFFQLKYSGLIYSNVQRSDYISKISTTNPSTLLLSLVTSHAYLVMLLQKLIFHYPLTSVFSQASRSDTKHIWPKSCSSKFSALLGNRKSHTSSISITWCISITWTLDKLTLIRLYKVYHKCKHRSKINCEKSRYENMWKLFTSLRRPQDN